MYARLPESPSKARCGGCAKHGGNTLQASSVTHRFTLTFPAVLQATAATQQRLAELQKQLEAEKAAERRAEQAEGSLSQAWAERLALREQVGITGALSPVMP
jgi:hypothetical protein